MQPVGDDCSDNGHHKVQAYPRYGAGRDGWRLAFVKAGNARARLGTAGFWGWLANAARGVNPGDLVAPLPSELD